MMTAKDFAATLAPCLTLAAGSGMSADDRDLWLTAAYKTLGEMPLDLLITGAEYAALHADHPSKIIPLITDKVGEQWAWRRNTPDYRVPAIAAPTKPVPPPLTWEEKVRFASGPMGPSLVAMGVDKGEITPEEAEVLLGKKKARG